MIRDCIENKTHINNRKINGFSLACLCGTRIQSLVCLVAPTSVGRNQTFSSQYGIH